MEHKVEKGQIESALRKSGLSIAGVDEVGRGCLAGPVVAACVALDYNALDQLDAKSKAMIRDSKTLSSTQRQAQIDLIQSLAFEYAIGEASAREIEDINILNATFLAMNRAVAKLKAQIDLLLVDGHLPIRNQSLPQKTVIKGDSLCYAIAAASILAKEYRDSFMRDQADTYPLYGFDQHVGYGTAKHLAAIKSSGICPLHRRNFAPIRDMIGH